MPIVISTLACLRGTSAMRCCAGFFMGNSLSDPEDLLILFIGSNTKLSTCLQSRSFVVIVAHVACFDLLPCSLEAPFGRRLTVQPGLLHFDHQGCELLFKELRLFVRTH